MVPLPFGPWKFKSFWLKIKCKLFYQTIQNTNFYRCTLKKGWKKDHITLRVLKVSTDLLPLRPRTCPIQKCVWQYYILYVFFLKRYPKCLQALWVWKYSQLTCNDLWRSPSFRKKKKKTIEIESFSSHSPWEGLLTINNKQKCPT